MFSIGVSDSSIEVLNLKKGLFGQMGVVSFGSVTLEEGIVKNGEILDCEKLAQKIEVYVKKGKINFTLPDLRTFTERIKLPPDVSRSAVDSFLREKMREIIPLAFEELAYDFKVVNETEKGKEVLLIAFPKKILIAYLKTFHCLNLTPILALPESLAAFEIIEETIVKEEIVLFIALGMKTSTFSFFDRFGPLLTLNESVDSQVVKEEIKKTAQFLEEKFGKEIKRIVLGGQGSADVDTDLFSKETGIWTTKADKILSDKLTKIPLTLSVGKNNPVLFINVLGLSLLAQKKEELYLLKEAKDWILEQKKKEEKEKEAEGKIAGEKKQAKGTDLRLLFRLRHLLIMIIVAGVTFAGILLMVKKPWMRKGQEKTLTPLPSQTPQALEVIPMPTVAFSRRDLKVKVLNGSGISGRAGEAAAVLEKLGYQVVETSNADSFDYEETIIKIKEENKSFLPLLTNDLKTHYTVSSEEEILPEDEEEDVVVIVGKE